MGHSDGGLYGRNIKRNTDSSGMSWEVLEVNKCFIRSRATCHSWHSMTKTLLIFCVILGNLSDAEHRSNEIIVWQTFLKRTTFRMWYVATSYFHLGLQWDKRVKQEDIKNMIFWFGEAKNEIQFNVTEKMDLKA